MRDELWIKLSESERKGFDYEELLIKVDDLIIDEDENEVYIKDEGEFFSFWVKKGRVDVPKKHHKKLITFLNENKIKYDSEVELE